MFFVSVWSFVLPLVFHPETIFGLISVYHFLPTHISRHSASQSCCTQQKLGPF